mgnify:CR=1 FL=1
MALRSLLDEGEVKEPNLSIGFPVLFTKIFVKFHFTLPFVGEFFPVSNS